MEKKLMDEILPVEVLSQNEIDKLLRAINEGVTYSKDIRPSADTRRIKIYDFKRPDKFSKDQLRTLSIIHNFFVQLIPVNLSPRLRSSIYPCVASVDCITYEEFLRSIPDFTSLVIVEIPPLKGCIAIEIDPVLSFPIIDLIFGGLGNDVKNRQEFTEIEQSVIKNILDGLLENLRNAWGHLVDLHPKLVRLETNKQFALAQVASPSEMVALVTMETKIGDTEGIIQIVYPYSAISPIVEKLSSASFYGSERGDYIRASKEKDSVHSTWENIPVTLTAELFRKDYSIRELINWKEDILILPLRPIVHDHCYLKIGNRRVWRCKVLEDQKWFFKKIEITGKTENPLGTEGRNMTINQLDQDVSDALSAVKVTVSAELGSAEMPLKHLFNIGEGSIVELDALAGEHVLLKVNGVTIANGEVVVVDEQFGVRVCEMLTKFDSVKQIEQEPAESAESREEGAQ